MTVDTANSNQAPQTFKVQELASWRAATALDQPLLVHLNGDTTWLLQLPYPAAHRPQDNHRSRFNILLDPWLQGPQSDVASWFSTQWHVVAPSVETLAELQQILAQLEQQETNTDDEPQTGPAKSYIDAVAISHEFTDHCHEATLRELSASTPVFATDKAADLIRSWRHFDTVITTPGYSFTSSNTTQSSQAGNAKLSRRKSTPAPPPLAVVSPSENHDPADWHKVLSVSPLPPWVGIGRVVTPGNSLYYHSAVLIVFDRGESSSSQDAEAGSPAADAVIYSPHGIKGTDLAGISQHPDINTLLLLHGLHDIKIWMTKQLNLGAHNGLEAVRASGARYWVATHDEVKTGGGFIAPLLRRVQYTLADAVEGAVNGSKSKDAGRGGEQTKSKEDEFDFVELGSGDGLVLGR